MLTQGKRSASDLTDVREEATQKPASLSIIIPALNEGRYIRGCLESIAGLNAAGMRIETIVVDNGSNDNTVELAMSLGATVLTKREGSIGSLRNVGAKAAKGELLAFLDADCIVPEDWLEKSLSYVRADKQDIIGFRMNIPSDANWVSQCWDALFTKRNVTSEVDWLPTGNMIMAREAFFSVKGFDEKLESNEDYDFCFRVRNLGHRIVSSSETSVLHLRPPRSLVQVFKKELWHGKEVFRVFVDDLIQSKDMNILRRKNGKVVAYALLYVILLLFFMGALLFAIVTRGLSPLWVALVLPFLSSFIVAASSSRSLKGKKMLPGLTVLLMVYGVSRALSLFSPRSKQKVDP